MNRNDEVGKAFIKANWLKLSATAIGKHLGISQRSVLDWGLKLGLGSKPKLRAAKSPEEKIAGESHAVITAGGRLTFAEMVAGLLQGQVERRQALQDELTQLGTLPADDDGKLRLRIQAVRSELSKVEVRILDLEEIEEDLCRLTGRKPKPLDEPETFDELINWLDESARRVKWGRAMAKMKVAADKVKADWCQLTEYADGTIDCPFLCPEMMSEKDEEENTHEQA